MTFQPGPVELAFYVHVFRDTTAVRNPFGPVRRFLWDEFADQSFRGARGNAAFDHYAGLAHSWAEGPWRDRFWQEFELNGEAAGGPLMLVDASWSPSNTAGAWVQREQPGIWNQAWFSSIRCALGMHQRGARLGDPGLVQRARQVLALTLAAPQQNGLFPTVFEATEPVRLSEGRGLDVDWTAARWTNSNRVPTELGVTQDHYHVADMSWTALWLTRWYNEVEQDPRILTFVKAYADRLVALQTPLGYFPAWLHPQTQVSAGVLNNSVESAASAWFLLEFARINPDPRYVPAAEAALSVMLNGPVPVGRWEDFETYWSNNNIGRFTNVGLRFLRNGVFKQNTLGMYWVAGACLEAYRTTGSQTYRDWGARVVDELCMWQQVWRPPFMYVPTLGGFGVMNADAEWNDARQSLCAELFLDWSRELDDDQLWDRGVAALRASFAMMYTASNPEAERQWEARYPFFSVLDEGFTMENYAHYEVPGPNGEGMGDFAIWTWGAGAAAQSWERIRSRFGSAQLEPSSARSRVVDSLALRRDNGAWFVDDLADKPRWVRVQYPNGRAETVWLDGTARLATDAAGR